MKRLPFIALLLATPAYGQARLDLTAEQGLALQSYYSCLYQQAGKADDGAAEVEALALEIAPNCRYLLGTAATVFSQGKSRAERDDLYKKWLGLEERQVIKMIWAVRRDRLAAGNTAAAQEAAPVQMAAAATPPARSPAAASTAVAADDKPMSEWRRAYIARHGHEPPVAAK
jgi:hypothetical protein